MPYDEQLAIRIREATPNVGLREQKMFGGLTFLSGGHIAVGIMGDRLLVRVAADQYDRTLAEPHVKPMEFGGRRMRGFVCVEPGGIEGEGALREWVRRGLEASSP